MSQTADGGRTPTGPTYRAHHLLWKLPGCVAVCDGYASCVLVIARGIHWTCFFEATARVHWR